MSLILEALKKSEAERRLGRAPGLLSPAPVVRRRHGPWSLLGVLVLAVLLSTGITWWMLRPAPVAPPAVPNAAPADAGTGRQAATVADPATQARPQPAAPVQPPSPRTAPDAPASPAPAPLATVRPPVERESLPVPAGEAPPAATVSTPAATPTPEESARADRHPGTVTGRPSLAPAASMARVPVEAEAEPALPGVHALPRDVQSALPPLRLSMHVFNEDPSERFVLIDGRRYGEGMAVADGLVLEMIRRDGVVLVFGDHRFLLKRPG